MTTEDNTAPTGQESDAPFSDSSRRLTLTDGGTTTADADGGELVDYPTTSVSFPVTVPPEIERSASQRMNDHGGDDLGKYLLDHYDLDPQWLTRDVDHDEWGEPASHALYSLVPESVYNAVVDAADDSPQQWVRDALVLRLELRDDDEILADVAAGDE